MLLKACDGLAIHPACFPAFGPETTGWASLRHYVGQAFWRMDGSAPKRKTKTQNAHAGLFLCLQRMPFFTRVLSSDMSIDSVKHIFGSELSVNLHIKKS